MCLCVVSCVQECGASAGVHRLGTPSSSESPHLQHQHYPRAKVLPSSYDADKVAYMTNLALLMLASEEVEARLYAALWIA